MVKYISNKRKIDILDMSILFLLFLFSINFMNQPNYIFIFLTGIVFIWLLIKRVDIYFSSEFIVLILCFTSYFLIYSNYFTISLQSFITFWVGPAIGYFIGSNIINNKNIIELKYIILTIGFGMFFHGALNMFLFFKNNSIGRMIPDIWLGSGILATLQGTFFTIICSFTFYALFICKGKVLKSILIISILFSIYSTIETASRTILIIVCVTFIINILLYLYINKEQKIMVMKIILYVSIILILIFLIYKYNILGIQDIYKHSPLYERINSDYQTSLMEDPRFELYKTILENILNYPMGGKKILETRYAHNLWLDTVNVVGIIPSSILVLYSGMTFLTLIKSLKCKYIRKEDKHLICSIYSALFLNFMVEPILEGVPYMFIIMCIINGVTKKYLIYHKQDNYNI